MIANLYVKNFMLFDEIEFNNFTPVNLFIGENDTGKTGILKLLYSITSGIELFSNRSRSGYAAAGYAPGSDLIEKIKDVFNNRNLVKHTGTSCLVQCSIKNNQKIEEIRLEINNNTDKKYLWKKDTSILYDFNTVFIPPKEILSIKNIIKYSQTAKIKDFDDTYLDIVSYIENPREIDENERLVLFRDHHKYDFYNGLVRLIDNNGGKRAVFIKNNINYEIDIVAEGIRKLGIFPVLERAGYLTKKTIIFVDEPENSIHPRALRELMRFFVDLSKEGVQIFIASHNQFVVQQLRNLAKKNKYSIHCYSLIKDKEKIKCLHFDLKDKIAENPILDEAISMFDESIENA